MRSSVATLTLLAWSATALPGLEVRQAKGGGQCAPVHIMVARASGESKGEGMLKSISSKLKESIKGADSEAIDYPAALAPYGTSEIKGVKAANEQLAAYVKRCPESKLVLMGYSQGADVMGSVLCGGGDHVSEQAIGRLPKTKVDLGPAVPPAPQEIASHVVAAVLMADPRFTKGMPFNKGTANNTGRFPHPPNQDCKGYTKRIASYCDTDDEFCDSGKSVGPHVAVLSKHSAEAVKWVTSRVQGAKPFPLVGDV